MPESDTSSEGIAVALFGAGGKMGLRVTEQIKDNPRYDIDYVEPANSGQAALNEQGVEVSSEDEALENAEVVILAVSDQLIGTISGQIVPKLDSGALVMLLDPAAAYAGALHDREDISYFIAHPCHPSFETAETSMSDPNPDWFGGQGRDEQDIVCSLHQGPEEDYTRGEVIARDINAPVRNVHRVTTEQMALLEPSLVETLAATLVAVIHEGMEEVVKQGVPEDAAYEFLMGHMRIHLGIIFGHTDFPYSDAAQEEIRTTREEIMAEDWKEYLSPEHTKARTKVIAGVEESSQ